MFLTLADATRSKQKQQLVRSFSKSYEPGDTTRVFYPITWENGEANLCVGMRCGHSVNDYKALGKIGAFIPTLSPLDADRTPIGQDLTFKFAKSIAPAIHAGKFKMEEDALNNKRWPTDESKRTALKELEHKFDAKGNLKAEKPIISTLQTHILAEPRVYKVINGVVDIDSGAPFIQKISIELSTKLMSIFKDPKYAPEPGDCYFEVEYVYPAGQEKVQSGKTLPAGLTKEFRLKNSAPEAFNRIAKDLECMTKEEDVIAVHFAKPIPEHTILQALTNYTFMNSHYIDALSVGSDNIRNILNTPEIAQEIELTRCLSNEDIIKAINESTATSVPNDSVVQNTTAILNDLADSVSKGAPVLSDLIKKPNVIESNDVPISMELDIQELSV